MASSVQADTISECSEASTLVDGSVISTVPDRHGFLGGQQYSPEPRQGPPPEIVLRREHKWLKMLAKWDFYMERNYGKVRERCRKGIFFCFHLFLFVFCAFVLLQKVYRCL